MILPPHGRRFTPQVKWALSIIPAGERSRRRRAQDVGYPWGCLGCLLASCAGSFWRQPCGDAPLAPPPVDLIAVIGCYLACCGATGFTECGGQC